MKDIFWKLSNWDHNMDTFVFFKKCPGQFFVLNPKSLCSFPPSGQLIERVLLSSMLNPGEQWQTHRHHGRTLSLEYRLRFRCDSNYYGPFCNKFCRARDDFFGHFNCDQTGSKVCMEGWTGPECKEGEKGNLKLGCIWVHYTLCLVWMVKKNSIHVYIKFKSWVMLV